MPTDHGQQTVVATLGLTIAGTRVEVRLPAPDRPAGREAILPAFWVLAEAVGAIGEEAARREGRSISCRAGCGACCRQVVPIAPTEARFLRAYVDSLPEPKRAEVRDRFAAALRRLNEAGLLETLRRPQQLTKDERRRLGLAYFRLGIPCPFLEAESCSIHPVRPLSCREYLVASPARHCADPSPEAIDPVDLPVRLSGVLSRFGGGEQPDPTTWVPLVLALEWAESHPDPVPDRPGLEWLAALVKGLTGRELTSAPAPEPAPE